MRKYFFSWFFVWLFVASASAQAQNAAELLEKAYKENSVEQLEHFLDVWRNEVPPVTDEELSSMNDTVQQAYKVFTSFYKPTLKDFPAYAKYLLVQNKIEVRVTSDKLNYTTDQEKYEYAVEYVKKRNRLFGDSLTNLRLKQLEKIKESNQDICEQLKRIVGFIPDLTMVSDGRLVATLKNFRPQISCDDKLPFYLTEKYYTLLKDFYKGYIDKYGHSDSEEKRKNFLNDFQSLSPSPQAWGVIFDKEMKCSVIYYKTTYTGNIAFLENEDGRWVLTYSWRYRIS